MNDAIPPKRTIKTQGADSLVIKMEAGDINDGNITLEGDIENINSQVLSHPYISIGEIHTPGQLRSRE
jgi:hypothetical protein